MFAKAFVVLDATAWDSWADASLAQMPTTPCDVIPLVGVEFVRAASQSAGQAWHRRYCIDQVFEGNRVVPIGTGHGQRQGNAAPVYGDVVAFAAKFAAIREVRAH